MSAEAECFALSPMQRGMVFDAAKEEIPGLNVMQVMAELREALDPPRLLQAWNQVIKRHEILRCAIVTEDSGEVSQRCHGSVEMPVLEEDWRNLPADRGRERLEDFLRADRDRGFNLSDPPLMRLALFREGRKRWRMCWTLHHLLLDTRGLLLVLDEIFTVYEALRHGAPPAFPAAPRFREYAAWHERQDWSESAKFWRRELNGFTTATSLGVERDADARNSGTRSWAEETTELSRSATRALKRLAQRTNVTPNAVLQGAWALLLSRYSGESDVVFGAIRACRKSNVPEATRTAGMFVNTVPLRVRVPDEMPLAEWLPGLRAQWMALREHENAPLAEVQRCSDVPRGTRLFETSFNYQEPSWDIALRAKGGPWHRRRFTLRNHPPFPLTIDLYGGAPKLVLKLIYDPRHFDAATITRMLGHYATLLGSMAANPGASLSQLEMLTAAERRQMVVDWNRTATRYPRESCIHELFEAQARRTPDAVAVVFGDRQLSYEKLNFRANRIANFLRSRGVRRGTMVGFCLERSADMVAAMLGILKAGGAYVPIDPEYPQERQGFMLRDTGTPVLLTQDRLCGQLPKSSAEVIRLDGDWALIRQHSSDPVKSGASADDLAYVIYTSGSTGTPKGVCVPHRAVVRLVRSTNYISLGPDDRIAQAANASFDAATFEIWGALLNGARTVGISKDVLLSPPDLAALLRDQGITAMFLTTALFNQMAREAPDGFRGLRHLLFGGEAVDPGCVRAVLQNGAPHRLLHVYGPTESTTFATWLHVKQVADEATTVPIGRPISNTTAYVLDRHGRPVPIGVPGELFCGGDGLALGYLKQPELSAEKFVRNPFRSDAGARLYRTGDLVRWLPEGDIEFLGRLDHQVKIRGFRIELGEIESALLLHSALRAVVVMVREDVPGNKSLVAYYAAGSVVSEQQLRNLLREKLPAYMVPAVFVAMKTIPLTPNGKVDRKALPIPWQLDRKDAPAFVAPQTEMEKLVAGLWADVLKQPVISASDHFFELGGHSLLVAVVIARLRKVLDRDIPIRLLFEKPTLQAFAGSLEGRQPETKVLQPSITRVSRGAPLPLSFYQERLWQNCASSAPASHHHPFCFRIKGPLDVSALERSLTVVIARHEILRTTFVVAGGHPQQVINPESPALVSIIEMTGSRHDKQRVADVLAGETRRPFDLARDVMFRTTLLRWSPVEHKLLFVFHGMVYDGVLRETLFSELSALYAAFTAGKPHRLPEPALQYADFAVWQRRWMRPDSEVYQQTLAYWKRQLGGQLQPLQLPLQRPKPAVRNLKDARRRIQLSNDLSRALIKLSHQRGVTLFVMLLAAFKVLLHHYTRQTDLLLGTYFSNRNHTEMEGVIGLLSNLLPLRSDLSGNPGFMELLEQVRETVLQAHTHQDIPYEELLRALSSENRPVPQMRAIFMLTNLVRPMLHFPGVVMSRVLATELGEMPWGFTLNVIQADDKLTCGWVFDTDLYDPAAVWRMTGHFNTVLEEVVANPGACLDELVPRGLATENSRLAASNIAS